MRNTFGLVLLSWVLQGFTCTAPSNASSSAESLKIFSITLNGSSATISGNGKGASVSGGEITISSPGTYRLSGVLHKGRVVVNSADKEQPVVLILNGAEINNPEGAPIYIRRAAKVVVELAEGTENRLTDGLTYQYDDPVDEEPNAALFSKVPLLFRGKGSLTVDARFNDGISGKDGVEIDGAKMVVKAADDALRGKDFVHIKGGDLSLISGGDGIKSDKGSDPELGYIQVDGGTIEICSEGDALSAKRAVTISDGLFRLTSGGGATQNLPDSLSAKAIKGSEQVTISGGNFRIDAADDALHSDFQIDISGGIFSVASADDALKADSCVTLSGGTLDITAAYEGIESGRILISGGRVTVVSTDDGINASRKGPREQNDGSLFAMNGGFLSVEAIRGDALDSNGDISISGGTVIAQGPSDGPEVGMDFNGACSITGGTFIMAGGSSFMTQIPGEESTQPSVSVKFPSILQAGSLVNLADSLGKPLVTFSPSRNFQSFIFSSPELIQGAHYTLYTGGTHSGESTNGVYEAGTYSSGALYQEIALSAMVTTLGDFASGRGFGPPPDGFGPPPGGFGPPPGGFGDRPEFGPPTGKRGNKQ